MIDVVVGISILPQMFLLHQLHYYLHLVPIYLNEKLYQDFNNYHLGLKINMKILLATESYYPNIDGGAIAQHRLVNGLVKKGHSIAVIAPGFSFNNQVEIDNGNKIFRTRGLTLPFYMNNKYHFSPFPLFQVKKIINSFKPEIVNVCSPYPIGTSALMCAKKYEIPNVGSIHILPENMLAPFYNLNIYNTFKQYSWKYLRGRKARDLASGQSPRND